MERLLRRITTSFPSAVVIVSGYYPFFSERSRNDFILKGLTKRFLKTVPGAPKMNSKEILVRLTSNSKDCKEVFKHESNETAEQRKERHNRRLLCRYASLGHPNKKGAELYAEAIIGFLPAALSLPNASK